MNTHPHPKGYVAPYKKHLSHLPADPTHPVWKDIPKTDLFQDIQGPTKPKPRHDTYAQMFWSDDYLFIRAHLIEPHIWATYTKHDSIIYHENDFEWFIDPNGDNHEYYEWEVNALGTTMDLFMNRPYITGGNYKMDWEIPGLHHQVHLQGTINNPSDTDTAWSVACAIPWSTFEHKPSPKSLPEPGDQWRINFSRVQWDLNVKDNKYQKVPDRPEYNWVWSPQYAINMHLPWHWGYIQFEHDPNFPFRPDPDHDERMKLIQVFESQLAHQNKHKSFNPNPTLPPGVEFNLKEKTYSARIRNDQGHWLAINQHAQITKNI